MKLSQLLTINLFIYLSSSLTNSERQSMEFLQRSLKMDMGNHSDSMGMGMGMGAEKTGMSMIEGMMGMGMGMGRGQLLSQAPTYAPTMPSVTTVQPTVSSTMDDSAESPNEIENGAPTDAPIVPTTTVPTEAPVRDNVVRLSDHFMSFVAPKATRAPTREEYDEMIERVRNWFETAVSTEYNDENIKLLNLELFNDFQVYGLNKEIPPRPENFNIYINFDYADYLFEDNSSSRELPSPADVFKVIRRSITTDFILDVVRSYKGTPFESTNEVYLAALKP